MDELRKNIMYNGVRYKIAVGQEGSGPPDGSTAGKVGVSYLDTLNMKLYVCTEMEGSGSEAVCTWTPAGELIEIKSQGAVYYTPVVTQPEDDRLRFEFRPSQAGMPIPAPVTVELPVGSGADSVDCVKTVNGAAPDKNGNVVVSGIKTITIQEV